MTELCNVLRGFSVTDTGPLQSEEGGLKRPISTLCNLGTTPYLWFHSMYLTEHKFSVNVC